MALASDVSDWMEHLLRWEIVASTRLLLRLVCETKGLVPLNLDLTNTGDNFSLMLLSGENPYLQLGSSSITCDATEPVDWMASTGMSSEGEIFDILATPDMTNSWWVSGDATAGGSIVPNQDNDHTEQVWIKANSETEDDMYAWPFYYR
jgi:hypothetical protein